MIDYILRDLFIFNGYYFISPNLRDLLLEERMG